MTGTVASRIVGATWPARKYTRPSSPRNGDVAVSPESGTRSGRSARCTAIIPAPVWMRISVGEIHCERKALPRLDAFRHAPPVAGAT